MYDLLSLERTEPFDQGGLPALWRPARRYLRLIEGIINYSVAILIQALIDKLSSVVLKEKVLKHFIEEALPEDQGSELCLLFDGTNSGVNAALKIILLAN